jgi:hypothetical protein
MKLSAIQIVSSSTSSTNPIGTTFGQPSFEAVATGKAFIVRKAAFISSVSATISLHRYILFIAGLKKVL